MRNLYKKWLSAFAIGIICIPAAWGQDFPMEKMSLEDMSAFEPQAGNWFIVGEVSMDPAVDVHHESGEEPDTRKKRRKRKKKDETPAAVTYQPGKGILLNMNTPEKKSQLITQWEHGDIDLAMEVMLPKGSNSGIYLQGRYEVQLLDSWGVKDAKFSDIGGIYRNWEQEPGKIYMGKAPLANAAKAPGLWQTLEISFRAPRFNDKGEKIANARFASVTLNGVRIHDNVEVPLPTGGPIENNEVATGPLMIQGDHGPVAFRNIRYRTLEDSDVALEDIQYSVFYGNFEDTGFTEGSPAEKGAIPALTWEVASADSAFAVRYTGTINIPEDDAYQFTFNANGMSRLTVDGREVSQKAISLSSGSYPFEVLYVRNQLWREPMLGLFVQSAGTHRKALHALSSFSPELNAVSPILIKVGSQPRLLRAFLDFEGDRNQRLTHTMAVGSPGGVHYIYDLKAGNLACAWRGRFIDATPMWHNRGDGSYQPLGVLQYFFTSPSLADLSSENAPFPEQSTQEDFKGKGYEIEESTGRPIFKYSYKGREVSDKIYPDEDYKMLIREVTVENSNEAQPLYFKLAEGASIDAMPDGAFNIEGQYYIRLLSDGKPVIRSVDGRKELVLTLNQNPVKYSIIW